jgi:hypothetical protein
LEANELAEVQRREQIAIQHQILLVLPRQTRNRPGGAERRCFGMR